MPGRAASQIYHGTRRKLGIFMKRFPEPAGPENGLNSRNPRKPIFATGTGTALAAQPATGPDPLTIIECVERERELRERERAPRVQVHEPLEVWGVGA